VRLGIGRFRKRSLHVLFDHDARLISEGIGIDNRRSWASNPRENLLE
jgi:hypothetical protein